MTRIRLLFIYLLIIIAGLLILVYFPYLSFYDRNLYLSKIASVEKEIAATEDLDSYVQNKESAFPHLRKGLGKAIIWNDEKTKVKTEYAFIYMPGFTATKMEISPVVEKLAKQFNANLFFSRLPSHGEEADDYSNARTEDFFVNAVEAIRIGERLGQKPIFIGLSTGATVLQYALNLTQAGYAFVGMSPAFYTKWHYSNMTLNPWVGRSIVKMVMGDHYEWKGHFPNQDLYWNTRYNTDILPEITRVFQISSWQDYSHLKIPYFLLYNKNDNVASPKNMLAKWGEAPNPLNKLMSLESRDSHVITGDITSPENTQKVVDEVAAWIKTL